MKDEIIIEKIKKGDESALDFLYKKHYKMMSKMVLKNTGTETEAQDVFQDALIIFWQKVLKNELVLTSKVSTYLYSICQNLWRKELERKKRNGGEMIELCEEIEYETKERNEIIKSAIDGLGDTCRRILTYYYFDGLSMNDIAEKMEFANSDTAKTKKYKCKKELDKRIKGAFSITDFLEY